MVAHTHTLHHDEGGDYGRVRNSVCGVSSGTRKPPHTWSHTLTHSTMIKGDILVRGKENSCEMGNGIYKQHLTNVIS
jgi:hypothetical protein